MKETGGSKAGGKKKMETGTPQKMGGEKLYVRKMA